MDVSDKVSEGRTVYWLEKYRFVAPINLEAVHSLETVHSLLLNFLATVRVLSLQAYVRGNLKRSSNSEYFQRLEVFTNLYANDRKLRGVRPFDFIEGQVRQLLAMNPLSQRENPGHRERRTVREGR